MSHGRPFHIVVTKEMRDAAFAGELMAQLRQHHVNMDIVAANHAADNDQPVETKSAISILVSELVDFFKTYQTGSTTDTSALSASQNWKNSWQQPSSNFKVSHSRKDLTHRVVHR